MNQQQQNRSFPTAKLPVGPCTIDAAMKSQVQSVKNTLPQHIGTTNKAAENLMFKWRQRSYKIKVTEYIDISQCKSPARPSNAKEVAQIKDGF